MANNLNEQEMEQSLNKIFSSKNEMVKKGQIVDATEKYFASNAKTTDFDGTVTNGKAEMLNKMQGFRERRIWIQLYLLS